MIRFRHPPRGRNTLPKPDSEAKLQRRGRRLRSGAYLLALVFSLSGLLLWLCTGKTNMGIILMECGIFFALLGYLHFLGEPHRLSQARCRQRGMIRLPFSAAAYQKRNRSHMYRLYSRLGFTNIRCLPTPGGKPGYMAAITINGAVPREGAWYHPDAAVIFVYYSTQTNQP